MSGITSLSGTTSGTATLDFGAGNRTADVVITGVSSTLATSRVLSVLRLEATADHPVDDLSVDPISVAVKDLVSGVGFTIRGEMDNAQANGLYRADWFISNT